MAVMKSKNNGGNKAQEKEEKKAPAQNGASSFEDRYKAADEENQKRGFAKLPIGKWEAKAVEGGVLDKDGTYMGWIDYEITESKEVDGKDVEGMKGRAFFAIEDDEANILVGASILHRQLSDMGYIDVEESFHSKEHIEELLTGIEDNPCEVVIKVAAKKGYINIYLDSVPEPVNAD